jgi:hypothetical protein
MIAEPAFEQVVHRLAETGVGLDLPSVGLLGEPLFEFVQNRLAVLLVKTLALVRTQVFGLGLDAINPGKAGHHLLALVGERAVDLHEIAAGVHDTIARNDWVSFGVVAGKAITHVKGRRQARLALGQDVGQVLPGVLAAGENQANGMLEPLADDARGEDARAIGLGVGLDLPA